MVVTSNSKISWRTLDKKESMRSRGKVLLSSSKILIRSVIRTLNRSMRYLLDRRTKLLKERSRLKGTILKRTRLRDVELREPS